jgi:hypothetical protein
MESGPGQAALVADGVTIEGTLLLAQVRAHGGVEMCTARVGQRVVLMGARLENPAGIALLMSGSEVSADVFCCNATFIGGSG